MDNNTTQDNSIQFGTIIHMVVDHLVWYFLCVALALGVAAFYIYRTPKIYVKEAKVIIDESDQESMMRDMTTLTRFSSVKTMKSDVENEMEAFKSPDLMSKVVTRLGLETSYSEKQILRSVDLFGKNPIAMRLAGGNPVSAFSFVVSRTGENSFKLSDFAVLNEKLDKDLEVEGHLGDTLSTPAGLLSIVLTESSTPWENDIVVSWANARVRSIPYSKGLSISAGAKMSSVLTLSYSSTSAYKSELILNELIDVYNEDWIYSKTQAARNTADFIDARLVTLESELSAIENELKNYKQENDIQDIKSLANSYMQTAQEFSNMSFEIENEMASAKYIKAFLMDPANSYAMIPAISQVGSPTMMAQVSEYNQLYARRQELLSTTNESNPLVKDISASMQALRAAVMVSIDNYISTLQLKQHNVTSEIKYIKGQARESSGKELQLVTIQRQQKLKESLFVFLQQKREENELSSRVTVGNLRKIVAPMGPLRPVSPKRNQILLIAFLIGLAIPFAFFYMRQALDVFIRSKEDLGNMNTPFLGEVPELAEKRKKLFSFLMHRPVFNDGHRSIMVMHGKRDVINESFRVLRTNLDMMLPKNEHHVLMVTSFNPGSGKTFISMNIAASMAVKNAKTIIVDLDMRKASLSESIGKEKKGVASYLTGACDSYSDLIKEVSENLYMMPVGPLPPNPAELLLSERFASMIASLKEEYDYVFMDCPPVGLVADSSIIAANVDMTLFVVRAGLLEKNKVGEIDQMLNGGVYKHLAVVMNGVEASSGNYGRYSYGRYGYGYGYGYGQTEDEKKK